MLSIVGFCLVTLYEFKKFLNFFYFLFPWVVFQNICFTFDIIWILFLIYFLFVFLWFLSIILITQWVVLVKFQLLKDPYIVEMNPTLTLIIISDAKFVLLIMCSSCWTYVHKRHQALVFIMLLCVTFICIVAYWFH